MLQQIRIDARLTGALAAASLALAGCDRGSDKPPAAPPPVAVEPPAPLPVPPLPPPPVSRLELLQALDAARSAYAAGQPDSQQNLAGRQFSIRQAFGCGGRADLKPEAGVAGWAWGARNETIEISLTPADWTSDLATGEDAERWEAAEGFWLTRPWLRTGDCPAVHEARPAAEAPGEDQSAEAAVAPTTPMAQSDGLAAVFEKGGSRIGRRGGRAFSLVIRDSQPLTPPAAGYRLVIEGRFTAFASGRAIRCRAAGVDDRPVCIAAASVDRVALETDERKPLKEWLPR